MTFVPYPAAIWDESPNTAITLTLMRWHYDAPTFTWTIVPYPVSESGKLADLSASRVMTLALLAAVGSTIRTLTLVRRADGAIIPF